MYPNSSLKYVDVFTLHPLLTNSSEPLFDHHERKVKCPSRITICSRSPGEPSETGAGSPSGALNCMGRSCLVTDTAQKLRSERAQAERLHHSFLVCLAWVLLSWQWKQFIYTILWELFTTTPVIKEAYKRRKQTWQVFIFAELFSPHKNRRVFLLFPHQSQVRVILPYKWKYWKKKNNNWHVIEEGKDTWILNVGSPFTGSNHKVALFLYFVVRREIFIGQTHKKGFLAEKTKLQFSENWDVTPPKSNDTSS